MSKDTLVLSLTILRSVRKELNRYRWIIKESTHPVLNKVEHSPVRENALCKFSPFSRGAHLSYCKDSD